MEIQHIEFDQNLILIINNQPIKITPFIMKGDPGNIKFGIDAPRSLAINREEIFVLKKENSTVE